MIRPLLTTTLMVVVVSVSAAACGSDSARLPTAQDSSAGGAVYEQRCASCHGSELQGTEQGPPQLSVVYEPNHHGDNAYRSAIQNGAPQHHWDFGDMPPVEDITDEQIELVISFIRGEQQRLGFQN